VILDDVLAALASSNYQISRHAAEAMADDAIDEAELLAATRNGEVIEDYPSAWPCPAALVLGSAILGRPIHMVWAHEPQMTRAILITVYLPDPTRWSPDFRTRKTS
jgi:hypothetical protein